MRQACAASVPHLSAGQGVIAWPELVSDNGGVDGFAAICKHSIQLPFRFLGRATASTMFRAMEVVDPSFSLPSLFEIASKTSWVVFNLGSDLAASCGRLLHEVVRQLGEHNCFAVEHGMGVVLLLYSPCVAHVLQREVASCFSLRQLIPQLYTMHFVSTLSGSAAAIKLSLEQIVREDCRAAWAIGPSMCHIDAHCPHCHVVPLSGSHAPSSRSMSMASACKY